MYNSYSRIKFGSVDKYEKHVIVYVKSEPKKIIYGFKIPQTQPQIQTS